MLGNPNSSLPALPAPDDFVDLRSETLSGVLSSASAVAYGRLLPIAAGSAAGSGRDGWVLVSDLLTRPGRLRRLAGTAGAHRFRRGDQDLVLAQVVRESVAALATATVHTWSCQRRLLDVSAANVALRDGDVAIVAGLRHPSLAVLPGDPLAGQPGVEVIEEATMLDRLLTRVLGERLPSGMSPGGPPDHISAIGTVIAAFRQLVRTGDRHLWGSVALGVSNALTQASHLAPARARADLETVLSAREDLARTVELVTARDRDGEPVTFALRRTCCLLYKLPGAVQCATCSLVCHEHRVTTVSEWHLAERQRLRRDA